MSKVISMNKKYKTRVGRDVRILCIDNCNDSKYCVVAIADGNVNTYTIEGLYYSYTTDDLDLIEVPEEKELWLEVYSVAKIVMQTFGFSPIIQMKHYDLG